MQQDFSPCLLAKEGPKEKSISLQMRAQSTLEETVQPLGSRMLFHIQISPEQVLFQNCNLKEYCELKTNCVSN